MKIFYSKKCIFLAVAIASFSLFFYLDYKKNPITYIILSKKLELFSYLFFKDIPAIYPRSDYYSINYQNTDFDREADSHFVKGNGYFSLLDMESIYKTEIPQKLRKIFDNYAKLNPKKSSDRKIIESAFDSGDSGGRFSYMNLIFHGVTPYNEALSKRAQEYIKFFSKKFIIINIAQYKENDEQCGKNSYDVSIIFDSSPTESMKMGIRSSGEICFIWDEKLKLSIYEIKDLKNKYKNYWI